MSPLQLAAAWATVVLGCAIQGSIGFGLGPVATPLLLLIEPRLVPGPILFLSMTLSMLVVLREREAIHFSGIAWGIAGRLPGTLLGAAAVASLPARMLTLMLAGLILLAVPMSVSRVHLRETNWTLFFIGALSGFMGTTASIGGPPIALVYQRSPGPRLRSTLAGYFVIGVAMSMVALAVVGRFGRSELLFAVTLVPAVLLGFAISSRLTGWIDRGRTRTVVLAVSVIAAVAVIVREVV